MSYLARLKALVGEKRPPRQLTELTEGASVGFVSDPGRHVSFDDGASQAAIEERAGLAADCVPPVYLDAWARLNCQKPFAVSEAEWRLALDDGGRFLDAWGCDAAEMGWTPGELFDVKRGLAWELAGRRVVALGPGYVRLDDGDRLTVGGFAKVARNSHTERTEKPGATRRQKEGRPK